MSDMYLCVSFTTACLLTIDKCYRLPSARLIMGLKYFGQGPDFVSMVVSYFNEFMA
jgi:hypothetical protein